MSAFSDGNAAIMERRMRRLGIVLGGASLCAGIAGSIAVLAQNIVWTLIAHFLAALAGGKAGAIADRRRLGTQFFPWVVAFMLPLFGGATAYFLLETMKRPRSGKLMEEYAAYLNDAASYRDSVPLLERSSPAEIISLGDVLSNPASDAEQRIAVEYLADMETQGACEVLRRAVATAGQEAYFFAMTAMTQMEDKMLARLGKFEDALGQVGENRGDVGLLLKTASAYVDFVYYKFAVGERRSEYLLRTEALLVRALECYSIGGSEIDEALIMLGRIKLGLNDGEGAVKYFSAYIVRNPERSLGYLWRAEAWHMLGRYANLREDCESARKCGEIPYNMRAVLEFWLPENPN